MLDQVECVREKEKLKQNHNKRIEIANYSILLQIEKREL